MIIMLFLQDEKKCGTKISLWHFTLQQYTSVEHYVQLFFPADALNTVLRGSVNSAALNYDLLQDGVQVQV